MVGSQRVNVRSVCGTDAYLAPELLLFDGNSPPYSEASDIYSYGILANEVLTEAIPWQGLKVTMIISKAMRNERPTRFLSENPLEMQWVESVVGDAFKENSCLHNSASCRPTADHIISVTEKLMLPSGKTEAQAENFIDDIVDFSLPVEKKEKVTNTISSLLEEMVSILSNPFTETEVKKEICGKLYHFGLEKKHDEMISAGVVPPLLICMAEGGELSILANRLIAMLCLDVNHHDYLIKCGVFPYLVKSFQEINEKEKIITLIGLQYLCYTESNLSLVLSTGLLDIIMGRLANGKIDQSSLEIVNIFSRNPEYTENLYACGVIPVLIMSMNNPDTELRSLAVLAAGTLIAISPLEKKRAFIVAGVLPLLLQGLLHGNDKAKGAIAIGLFYLADHEEFYNRMLHSGILEHLANCIEWKGDPAVKKVIVEHAVGTFAKISRVESYRISCVANVGAVAPIIPLVMSGEGKTKQFACEIGRNLIDWMDNIVHLYGKDKDTSIK